MRIALDAIPLAAAKTGIGHYTDALAHSLASLHSAHEYVLLSPFDFVFDVTNGHPRNLNKQFFPVRRVFRKWWLLGLPAMLQLSPMDLFHGTNYCIPIYSPCPTVVTIHDLSLFTQSHTHEELNVVRGKRRVPIMARRASAIISPSEWTKREIIQHLGIPPEKIRIIAEAARTEMKPVAADQCRPILDRHEIHPPYLLYVGTIEPRKNLLTLIRSYDKLVRTTPHKPQLVLAGGRGWLYDEVFKQVEELKLADMVRFTGYVDDRDLPALYSAAHAFVYPSFYEGFGLPPLEAMACGTPVITSNTTSLPEVVGKAGQMHDPNDVEALTRAIVSLFDDTNTRNHFVRTGLEQAARFSWDRAARETQSLYDEVMAK